MFVRSGSRSFLFFVSLFHFLRLVLALGQGLIVRFLVSDRCLVRGCKNVSRFVVSDWCWCLTEACLSVRFSDR